MPSRPQLPRFLSNQTVSAIINACAIVFLCANLIQNYVLFHDRAISQSSHFNHPGDAPMVVNSQSSGLRQTASFQKNDQSEEYNPISLTIPRGKAVALPSIRISGEEEKSIKREIYGGKGDKPHLGGFTEFDPMGVSPSLWKHMVSQYGVKSVLDVGCGRGISTSWFVTHDLEYVQCVEGSHDAVQQNIVPNAKDVVVEHDFSRGPWWPEKTVDAVWCVEFTEHVGRNFQPNYLTAFRKAALIFVTHSNWGGWHHVEVHDDDWWRMRFEAAGLVYSNALTIDARTMASKDQTLKNLTLDMEDDKLYFVAQHLYLNVQVFINPMVASLPEHSHLFAEHGCYGGKDKQNKKIHLDCLHAGKKDEYLTPLPESFKPLPLTEEMDKKWFDLVKNFKTAGRKKKDL